MNHSARYLKLDFDTLPKTRVGILTRYRRIAIVLSVSKVVPTSVNVFLTSMGEHLKIGIANTPKAFPDLALAGIQAACGSDFVREAHNIKRLLILQNSKGKRKIALGWWNCLYSEKHTLIGNKTVRIGREKPSAYRTKALSKVLRLPPIEQKNRIGGMQTHKTTTNRATKGKKQAIPHKASHLKKNGLNDDPHTDWYAGH